MANYVPLNTETHRSMRVIADRGAEYGENIHICPVVADELSNLVLDYPACLIKDPNNGQFGLCVLLGFESGENLFLEGDCWDACYVPANMRCMPFRVAFTTAEGEPHKPENTVLTIDLDSSRVQEERGEALFNSDGSPSAFLQNINGELSRLMSGVESTRAFIDLLVDKDLIEPARISVSFADGEKKNFDGLYTINHEKLAGLPEETVQLMYERGYLQACTMIVVSMGQVQRLINLRNARRAAGA